MALVKQWQSEIDKKLKGAPYNLQTCLLHMKKMTWPQIKTFDVVLTTYGSIGAELKRYNNHVAERQKASGYDAAQDEELHRLCPLLHPRTRFYRVILDEAQYIKNHLTLSSTAAARLNATYRWCLTGTPMMNGAQELGPLIRFLHIKPYDNKRLFDRVSNCRPFLSKPVQLTQNRRLRVFTPPRADGGGTTKPRSGPWASSRCC